MQMLNMKALFHIKYTALHKQLIFIECKVSKKKLKVDHFRCNFSESHSI